MKNCKDLIIIGSGGFAREVRQLIDYNIRDNNYNILGWVSNEEKGTIIDGLKVLGDDEWLINYNLPVCIVIAIGNSCIRKIIYSKIKCKTNFVYPNIVAKDAINIDKNLLGKGAIISCGNIFTTSISIGDFLFVICHVPLGMIAL